MTPDKRKFKRRTLTCGSTAVSLDGKSRQDCRFADISAKGARLGLEDTGSLPVNFMLVLSERARLFRRCHIVWRNEKQVGVSFRAG